MQLELNGLMKRHKFKEHFQDSREALYRDVSPRRTGNSFWHLERPAINLEMVLHEYILVYFNCPSSMSINVLRNLLKTTLLTFWQQLRERMVVV